MTSFALCGCLPAAWSFVCGELFSEVMLSDSSFYRLSVKILSNLLRELEADGINSSMFREQRGHFLGIICRVPFVAPLGQSFSTCL